MICSLFYLSIIPEMKSSLKNAVGSSRLRIVLRIKYSHLGKSNLRAVNYEVYLRDCHSKLSPSR